MGDGHAPEGARIEDGRLLYDDGTGAGYDLTDKLRESVTALARVPEHRTLSQLAQRIVDELWLDDAEPERAERLWTATVEIPVNFEVAAKTRDEAERLIDRRFAQLYAVAEAALAPHLEPLSTPVNASLGARYDDTDVVPAEMIVDRRVLFEGDHG